MLAVETKTNIEKENYFSFVVILITVPFIFSEILNSPRIQITKFIIR